jgi:hypothetical protein
MGRILNLFCLLLLLGAASCSNPAPIQDGSLVLILEDGIIRAQKSAARKGRSKGAAFCIVDLDRSHSSTTRNPVSFSW